MSHSLDQAPVLPEQLVSDYEASERAQEVFDRWSGLSFDDLCSATPEPELLCVNGKRVIRYADLQSSQDQPDPAETVVMSLPVGNAWGPATYLISKMTQEVVAPNGRLVVFPNNNHGKIAYMMSETERQRIAEGDFSPFSERQVRACEALGIESVGLVMGRSMGAALGAEFSDYASNHLQLGAVMLDESPNTYPNGRTALELRRAVSRERAEVIPSYRDTHLPAYIEAMKADNPIRFYARLAKFLVGSNFQQPNPAVNSGFRDSDFYEDISDFLTKSPLSSLLLSTADKSTVSCAAAIEDYVDKVNIEQDHDIVRHEVYSGYHVTAGDPIVLSLLGLRGLAWHKEVQAARHAGSDGHESIGAVAS